MNHPNVLTIHHAGVQDGAAFLVSELLEGKTLREEMNSGALPVRGHQMTLSNQLGRGSCLKKWPKEQLQQLIALYQSHWGPTDDWTDEQLEWLVEVEKAMDQQAIRQGETVECELVGGGSVAGLPLELAGAAAQ